MGSEMHDRQVNKNPEEETKVSAADKDSSGEPKCTAVIDVKSRSSKSESSKEEKVCRICHFGSEPSSNSSELISLGCDCRGELGLSHRHCADAWFELRGSRLCEICGKTAENMSRNNNDAEETSIFMMEWNEMRLAAAALDSSRGSSRRCKKSFCNILLGCLIVAFVLPWFFRGTGMF